MRLFANGHISIPLHKTELEISSLFRYSCFILSEAYDLNFVMATHRIELKIYFDVTNSL